MKQSPHLACLLLLTLSTTTTATTTPAPTLTCPNITSTSIRCTWSAPLPSSPPNDRYYVVLTDPSDPAFPFPSTTRPFAVRTTATTEVVVDDLLPGTALAIGVRAHPLGAPSAVWGWEDYAAPILVRTLPAPRHAPRALRRQPQEGGEGGAPRSISLQWEGAAVEVGGVGAVHKVGAVHSAGAVDTDGALPRTMGKAAFEVGWALVPMHDDAVARSLEPYSSSGGSVPGELPWSWVGVAWLDQAWLERRDQASVGASASPASPASSSSPSSSASSSTSSVTHTHTLGDLEPGRSYLVRVRQTTTMHTMDVMVGTSDAVVFRTHRDDGTLYTTAYRISEYQFLPDFLANHDTASVGAMPVYIMDHNPINTSSVSPHWDQCQAALPSILPGRHGTGLSCLHYAATHKRAEVTAVCGNFSTADDSLGWDVHWCVWP